LLITAEIRPVTCGKSVGGFIRIPDTSDSVAAV